MLALRMFLMVWHPERLEDAVHNPFGRLLAESWIK